MAGSSKPPSKVFTIVEVLEKVLLNLTITELTRVERVSSVWKDVIRKAPGLQEQRFLKAPCWTGRAEVHGRVCTSPSHHAGETICLWR